VPTSQWELLAWLRELGFPVTNDASRFDDIESAIAHTETWATRRDELPFEADGMVIKIDDLPPGCRPGLCREGSTRGDRFKFPARGGSPPGCWASKWRSGARVVLTRARSLEPVEINGVIVQECHLCTTSTYIAEKDIRARGDRVLVKRAGEVIL